MTREPVATKGHASTWLWHWVCDRIGCTSTDSVAAPRDRLPSPEDMQSQGWFVAKVWGDRCPWCVTTGLVPDVEPWSSATPFRRAAS